VLGRRQGATKIQAAAPHKTISQIKENQKRKLSRVMQALLKWMKAPQNSNWLRGSAAIEELPRACLVMARQ
jgi:hypothetical protein